MLAQNKQPQRVIDLIKASFSAWSATLKHVRSFIGPLTVAKTLYLMLFLKLTNAAGQPISAHGSMLALVLIAAMTACILACCFFSVFSMRMGHALSPMQVVFVVRRRAFIYLSVWFLCALLSLFGSMFFLIPGILIYIYTKYAKLIALFENVTPMQAMAASIRLVAKNGWRVLAIEAFIVIAGFIALFGGQSITALLAAPLHGAFVTDPGSQAIVDGVSNFLVVLVVQLVMVPLIVNIQILQYHDLKLRYRMKNRNHIEEDTVVC